MKKQTLGVRFPLSVYALIPVTLAANSAKQAANYPEGYRKYPVVQSLVIQKDHKDFEIFGRYSSYVYQKGGVQPWTNFMAILTSSVRLIQLTTYGEQGDLALTM